MSDGLLSAEEKLYEILAAPIRTCADYTPKLGGSDGEIDLGSFMRMYGEDPFYHWLGLDYLSLYVAHKAAGALTSVYRQIGIGVERLFRGILRESLGLAPNQVQWSYEVTNARGKVQSLTLDGIVRVSDLESEASSRFRAWLDDLPHHVGSRLEGPLAGAVFEVRQGYKSADSKRQNADLRSAMRAFQERLSFVLLVFSNQVNYAVERRYRSDGLVVLTGNLSGDVYRSSYAFLEEVVGFDAVGFFERAAPRLRDEVQGVLDAIVAIG